MKQKFKRSMRILLACLVFLLLEPTIGLVGWCVLWFVNYPTGDNDASIRCCRWLLRSPSFVSRCMDSFDHRRKRQAFGACWTIENTSLSFVNSELINRSTAPNRETAERICCANLFFQRTGDARLLTMIRNECEENGNLEAVSRIDLILETNGWDGNAGHGDQSSKEAHGVCPR